MEQFLAQIRVGNFRGGRVVMGYMRRPQKRPDELVDDVSEETRRKLPIAFDSEDEARVYIARAKGRKVERCQTPQCDHSELCGIYQLVHGSIEESMIRWKGKHS